MITLEYLYIFAGLVFAGFAAMSALDHANPKRIGNALFWGLFAASFLIGSHLTDFQNGLLVLALVVTGGFTFLGRSAPQTTSPEERVASAQTRGNGLFGVALIIPVVALIGTLALKSSGLVDAK